MNPYVGFVLVANMHIRLKVRSTFFRAVSHAQALFLCVCASFLSALNLFTRRLDSTTLLSLTGFAPGLLSGPCCSGVLKKPVMNDFLPLSMCISTFLQTLQLCIIQMMSEPLPI